MVPRREQDEGGGPVAKVWIAVLDVLCHALVVIGLLLFVVSIGGVDDPPTAKRIWMLIEPLARHGLWLGLLGVLIASVVFVLTGVRIEPTRWK
jgi:hypothetical protein